MQCEIPSSMKLTEAEKNIYRVGFGEGYDYGYETFVTGTMEQLAQEGLTPPNATQIFAQYKTDTFSILLPMTWNVGTRTSYQQNDQELERVFADYFIDYSDMVLIGSTPWGGMIHITQDKDFSYAPFMAKFTNDEIQLSESIRIQRDMHKMFRLIIILCLAGTFCAYHAGCGWKRKE